MEKFKAVEKAMKTKAYSKEGLSGPIKLDPKEQQKVELCDFLSNMVDGLEQQVEALEAEAETLQAGMKKGKANKDKANRVAEIERIIEKHKFHQAKLELIQRSLENGSVEIEPVEELKDSIEYYVAESAGGADPPDDDGMYDELDLGDNEEVFGMAQDGDKPSSEDTKSVQDDLELETAKPPSGKARAPQEPALSGRRPSTQLKSPLPTLATLHQPIAAPSSASSSSSAMKPASLPTRPAGEGLKYASAAAAAAAASDKNLGIAPLPPPTMPTPVNVGISPLPPVQVARSSAASSPAITMAQPATASHAPEPKPAPQQVPPSSEPTPTQSSSKALPPAPTAKAEAKTSSRAAGKAPAAEPSKGLFWCLSRVSRRTNMCSSSSSSSSSGSSNGSSTAAAAITTQWSRASNKWHQIYQRGTRRRRINLPPTILPG